MKSLAIGVALLTCAACRAPDQTAESSDTAATPPPHPTVVLETSKGTIVIELYPEQAPETVRNFLRHVRSGFYDGLIFHRVIRDFVIQTGLLTEDMRTRTTTVLGIANEAQNGLENRRGTVAMARTGDPHSATSEFYINVKDNAKLDFREATYEGWGYAVFGRVTDGMDVVDAIASLPTVRRGRFGNLPSTPTVIRRAYVREGTAG